LSYDPCWKKIEFGLIFEEIFIFENQLPAILYYGESKLPKLLATGSGIAPSHLLRGVINDFFPAKKSLHLLICGVVTPRIIYYAESQLKCTSDLGELMLCISFTTGSRHQYQLFQQKYHWSLKIHRVQSILPILTKFSENQAWLVFYTFVLNMIYSIHENGRLKKKHSLFRLNFGILP